jgi:hypothetical protein
MPGASPAISSIRDNGGGPTPAGGALLPDQGDQREDAALALVVGPQNQRHVLDRHHDGDRPDDDGEQAVDAVGRRRNGVRVVRVEDRLDRVDGAGPDVAEDDA